MLKLDESYFCYTKFEQIKELASNFDVYLTY